MDKNQYLKITQWQNKVFTKSTALSCVNHLQEEVNELKEEIIKGNIDKSEVADCFLLMIGICNKLGMTYEDVTACIDDKMEVNLLRKWGEVNEKGYVKHI